jgi:hypothetical protein
MFVLLGDPALRLPVLPVDVKLTLPEAVAAGENITVKGQAPPRLTGAKVLVTLERPATSKSTEVKPLPRTPGDERDRVMRANHQAANQFVLAQAETVVKADRFEVRLQAPDKLPWSRLLVRAYAATEQQEGLGVAPLPVKSP